MPDRKKLHIKNLQKSVDAKKILKGISLSVEQGEVVGFLGPNGAGKTTLFSTIMGIQFPTKGTISIGKTDITKLPIYKRAKMGMGYLPQDSSIFRGLSVEDNILAILEFVEKDDEVIQDRLDQLLDEFSIQHIRHSDALSLSGGERRRTEIARALATKPKFLLLDEPFAGIDPISVDEIRELIHHLKEKGIGILITDHNVRETLDICDRAYIISSGKIIAAGSKDEIVNNPEVKRVYLGKRFRL